MSENLNNLNKVLEAKNLRISFRTINGTVKAVRGISFTLHRGRTLAIVGESGSGKSVTSRAIMGILADNKIVEEGEILYDGKDLLNLSEEQYVKIRGSRISMIFQDPMSSLNPIMKVGKQITESMILKDKASRKEAKKSFGFLTKNLENFVYINKVNIDLKEKYKLLENDSLDYIYQDSDFFNLVENLLKTNNENRKDNSLVAKQLLEQILNEGLIDDKEIKVKELKKYYKTLKKQVSICENRLRRGRDIQISTFYVSLVNIVKEYLKALDREEKERKELAKHEAAVTKGKKSKYDSAKKRAFASEIDTSHSSIALRANKLFVSTIEHLDELMNKEYKESKDRVKNFCEYLFDSYKTMNHKTPKKVFYDKAIELMTEVGIPEPQIRINQYPFQFSGGMRQRIVIAIALASNPEILICDEPTTALDVTIQAQILELINRIKEDRKLSIIFITHNLGVVANMADDIAVMYAGKIVEYGTSEDIFYDPRHPYTWALLGSMPDLETKEKLDAIPGTPPNMIIPPKGDAFAARNKYAMKVDFEYEPPLFKVNEHHFAATWLLYPNAPKVKPPKIVTSRIERMKKLYEESLERNKEEA